MGATDAGWVYVDLAVILRSTSDSVKSPSCPRFDVKSFGEVGQRQEPQLA